jgi:hypothetical protein
VTGSLTRGVEKLRIEWFFQKNDYVSVAAMLVYE